MSFLEPAFVHHGNHEIDARPYVLKAIRGERLIRADKSEEFVQAFVRVFENGGTGYTWRKMGRPLTDEERCEFNMYGFQISREAYDLLSQPGQRALASDFDTLISRISKDIYRRWRVLALADIALGGGPYARPCYVRFETMGWECCAKAKLLNGSTFEWSNTLTLPLAGCINDNCSCDMRPLVGTEYKDYVR